MAICFNNVPLLGLIERPNTRIEKGLFKMNFFNADPLLVAFTDGDPDGLPMRNRHPYQNADKTDRVQPKPERITSPSGHAGPTITAGCASTWVSWLASCLPRPPVPGRPPVGTAVGARRVVPSALQHGFPASHRYAVSSSFARSCRVWEA
ncbi:hypothetical protein LZ30DRAFT_479384 [Colletotrichum cereale]|nr:hypothetical protein LZ30DRAFT_479384 [Colletotrichum cereale]